VGGSSGSSDVEAMLQLVYLQMTQPRKDAAIYSAYVDRQRELAQNNLARPESVFADTVTATLYNNSPRVLRAPSRPISTSWRWTACSISITAACRARATSPSSSSAASMWRRSSR
jgi:hypothetical protein